jgi:hypothetical protein
MIFHYFFLGKTSFFLLGNALESAKTKVVLRGKFWVKKEPVFEPHRISAMICASCD